MAARRAPPTSSRAAPAREHLISRAEMARRLGISRPAITKACREGGRLAPACKGNSINVLHEVAQRWLVDRAGVLDRVDGATPTRATREQLGAPPQQHVCEHGDHPAPPGQRFCSRQCAECELTDFDASKVECAGICLHAIPPAAIPPSRAAAGSRSGSGTAAAASIPVEIPEQRARAQRRRPAPAPDPIELEPIEVDGDEPEAARSIEDLEAELGPREWTDLGELAEPLTVLSERYGNAKDFEGWIRARKALEEARKAQMLRERIEGRLIARTTVVRAFDHVDTAFRLLLSDAPRAIATRIAPQDVATVAALVRDVMSQHLDACKGKIDLSLASDDPLAPLAEAAE
jgi:hypothetical protein